MKKKNNKPVVVVKEKFVIPQIDINYEGLKKTKPGFEKSIAASPFYGSKVKDKVYVPDNKGVVDVDKAYDAFRPTEDKHISDEELIDKYGTKYHEFNIIDENKRKEILGVEYEPEPEPVVEPEVEEEALEEDLGVRTIEEPKEPYVSQIYYRKPQIEENKEEVKVEPTRPVERPQQVNTYQQPQQVNTYQQPQNPAPSYEAPQVPRFDEPVKPRLDLGLDEEVVKSVPQEVVKDNYELPPLDLFKRSNGQSDEIPDWLIEKKEIINKLLQDFDVDGEVVNYTKGPAFTRYEIMLQSGVKVNKVTSLYDNFQMELGAKSIRILAPIPGKKTVGIEVPNNKTDMVYFGDMIDDSFIHDGKPLRVALGKNIDGETIYKRIDDFPHLLVGGATKSGKSVCINTILISLLAKNNPDDLKLILIDPKKVEMSFYEEIPHLVTPVISDPKMASGGLQWAVDEMERRYDTLARNHVRNIEDYNKKAANYPELKKMCYIVIVIDELADLMMTCSQDVEDSIKRITQKARAAGIHLIVATQRPSVQIVSGNIKANIPARIGFRVASYVDSQTILDEAGAETLLGRGDMLIKDNDQPERVQGAYISDDEISAVCDHIRYQRRPKYIFTHEDLKKQIEDVEVQTRTDGFQESEGTIYEVAKFCIVEGQASINQIQNNFGFGFNRAQRVVNILEQRRILGPKTGSTKGREVLMSLSELNQMFGRQDEENL